MAITDSNALAAMLSHHRALEEGLKARVAAVTHAVAAGAAHETAVGDLVAYLASEVLTHAQAEEHTLYPAAAQGGLTATVSGMLAEHRALSTAAERLAGAPDGRAAATAAVDITSLFSGHVAKENDILLPALASRDDVSLAALLDQMHHSFEEAKKGAPATDTAATDPLAAVPAREGSGEQVAGHEVDVRALTPSRRHETIFAAYHALPPGAGFVLVNDHDPRPLRYQFEAEHPGEHTWEYLETGPEVWRVRIGRTAARQ